MAKQKNEAAPKELKQGIVTCLLGGSITVALFYLFAKLIVSQTLAQSTFATFATLGICLGCFISSVILALQRKAGGLVCGLICFVAFAVVLLASGWMCGARMLTSAAVLRLVLLCVSGCVGGCLGVSRAENRARRRRKAGKT